LKLNDLLALLSRFESTLSDFSFEELNVEDATHLKNSFQHFKDVLQVKILDENQDCEPSKEKKEILGGPKSSLQESCFIDTVCDEIKTPLNNIIGFTDLLEQSILDNEQQLNVNSIQLASHNLLEIVSELQEYSKMASNKKQKIYTEFDLYGLVRDVTFLCNTLIVNSEVTLTSNIDPDVPKLLTGDPSKLSQVLLTAMGNAIKSVSIGELCLNIAQSKTSEEELLLEFEILNDSSGSKNDENHQILDPLGQLNHFKNTELDSPSLRGSMVKLIIENLGGSINVKNNLGVGTNFKFVLPFGYGKQKLQPKSTIPSKESIQNIKSVAGMNILVFEDNLLNQRLIEQRLKAWKCHMHITDNPDYGISVLECNDIDLVFMDLRMPIMSGFEITKLIRNNNSLRVRQIPIIALTADYTIRDQESCKAHGIDDYLLKPFSPDELLAKLLKHISSYKKPNSNFITEPQVPINSEKELVDLTQLLSDCGDDIAVLEDLIDLFKTNVTEFLENAKIQINQEDADGLAFSSHKMKAGLGMVQATGLLETVVEIQNSSKEMADWKHLEFLFVCFSRAYPDVENAIEKEVEDLKKLK